MSDQKRYSVKPLEWQQGSVSRLIFSSTSVGKYGIWEYENGNVDLEYSFRGFGGPKGDDSYFRCKSVEEAKEKAWDHYLKLLLPCLQEVQE